MQILKWICVTSTVLFGALATVPAKATSEDVQGGPVMLSATLSVPENGDFESDLATDWVIHGNVSWYSDPSAYPNQNHVVLLKEPGLGGMSTLSQTFTIPGGAEYLSFRYSLSRNPQVRTSIVPPDSFTVSLYERDSGSTIRVLPVEPTTEPVMSLGFFYCDSDANPPLYGPIVVPTTTPNFDKSYTVSLDVSGIATPKEVTLEFCLASGANDVSTFVMVDDVELIGSGGCPDGYCCDSVTNEILGLLDDGVVCTEDLCHVVDGSTQLHHEPWDCCGSCVDTTRETDIYFMMDNTGSTSVEDWEKAKGWIISVLALYEQFEVKPMIAVGYFHHRNGAETVIGFTDNYIDVRNAVEGLDDAPTGGTSVANALVKAGTEFAVARNIPNRDADQYLILITDGWTNLYGADDICPQSRGQPLIKNT